MTSKFYRRTKNTKAISEWKRNQRNAAKMAWEPKLEGDTGYVYVFRLNTDGDYKIGMSKNWQRRLNDIKTAAPRATCVYSAMVSDMRAVEKDLHHIFREKRVAREVFKLEAGDLYFINTHITDLKQRGVIR